MIIKNKKKHPRKKVTSSPGKTAATHRSWLNLLVCRHTRACLTGLYRFSRVPFTTLVTIAIISLSLALPLGLYFLLQNARIVSNSFEHSTQISLVLSTDAEQKDIDQLIKQLQRNPEIAEVIYISPQQGLQEFQQLTGFEDILALLPENPLPPIIQIQPALGIQSSSAITELVTRLKALPGVEFARVDVQWVKKLNAILEIAHRTVLALGVLFACGIILIIGNTVRLTTERYRDEVEITKLIGATNAFVRRPFLYAGIFYGTFGAILAWLLVDFTVLWLQAPIKDLALLYHSAFELQELDYLSAITIITIGALLGLVGSYFAVDYHLQTIEKEMAI
jgi:cell division transport system permease protein